MASRASLLWIAPVLLTLGLLRADRSHAITIEAGDLFVLDELVGLVHVDAETGDETIIPTPGLALNPNALVLDADGHHLILVSRNDLIRFDPITSVSSVLTSGGYLDDFMGRVALGPGGEILFTSTRLVSPGDLDGTIVRVDPTTGDQIPVHSGGLLSSVWDVAIDSGGNYFVESSSTVVRIDGETGDHSFFLWDPGVYYGRLDVLPDDRLVVHVYEDFSAIPSTLLIIDPTTGASSEIPLFFGPNFGNTGVVTTEEGDIYHSGCNWTSEFCDWGVVSRSTSPTEDVYWGIAPRAFDIVPLPEPARLTLLLSGVIFLVVVERLRARLPTVAGR
jgi:streptogramin lyase